jgi:flagellar basal body-associated protein FliL
MLLVQAQGLSKLTWIIIALLLLASLALCMYLFRRFKKAEPEAIEEEWGLSRGSLLLGEAGDRGREAANERPSGGRFEEPRATWPHSPEPAVEQTDFSPFDEEIWAELERAGRAATAPQNREPDVPASTGPSHISPEPLFLARYGQKEYDKVGLGGTIALLLAMALIGGTAAAYFFVPAFRSRANALIARARGSDKQAEPAPAKAQIYPLPPEIQKGRVKVKGLIYNTSAEELRDLYLEVELMRAGAELPDIRRIRVAPAQLGPGQQGRYEFEYADQEYSSYKIARLITRDGSPLKFTFPGKQ